MKARLILIASLVAVASSVGMLPNKALACHRYISHWNCTDTLPEKYVKVFHDVLNSGSNMSWWLASTVSGVDVRTNALIPAIAEWESAMTGANGFSQDPQQFSEAAGSGSADVLVYLVDESAEFPGCFPPAPTRYQTAAVTCYDWGVFDTTRDGYYLDDNDPTKIYVNAYDFNYLAYDGWKSVLSHEFGHCCAARSDGTQSAWNGETTAPHTVVSFVRTDEPTPGNLRIISIDERVGAEWSLGNSVNLRN